MDMEESMKLSTLALIATLAVVGCQARHPNLSSRCQPGELLFNGPDKNLPSHACNNFGRWMELTENTGGNPWAGVKGVTP
jgi:hypothetical protein